MELIKSASNSQDEILQGIIKLHCPKGFDLDPTYSKGNFYKTIPQPTWKVDLLPQSDDVMECDCRSLPFENYELASVIFDPPFMFGAHGQTKNNIMNKRFTMFDSWAELESMYKASLKEFYRILKPRGILVFKCQDYTDSVTTLTHCLVYQWAKELGFQEVDLFIQVATSGRIYNPSLVQRHSRKFHCYWFVLRK